MIIPTESPRLLNEGFFFLGTTPLNPQERRIATLSAGTFPKISSTKTACFTGHGVVEYPLRLQTFVCIFYSQGLSMRYCIWNNKGGVGKTFLTYCLSTEYAIRHPEKTVVAVDMCPQANISEMLLGGNGDGEINLATCCENDRTIASYIKRRFEKSQFERLGTETTFFVPVHQYNKKMPSNLFLLPGDVDLDICAALIDYMGSSPRRGAWLTSRHLLVDLLDVFEGNAKTDTTVFIDSNPSFANYTQLGIIAADRLIVPCTADSASIRGIFNILRLVFGVKSPNEISADEVFDTFFTKLQDVGVSPKIHAFVLNKARTSNSSASAAYRSHVGEIRRITTEIAATHSKCFTPTTTSERIYEMKDCNTIAPVMSYNGLPPSQLHQTRYTVYDEQPQVNQTQIDPFMEALQRLVAGLA